jgi:large subunit ribosomal protein L24
VLRVLPEKGRVVVERINMIKKHQRPTQKLRQGGIIEREGALHLSNVMLVDPTSDRPTRVGMRALGDGKKVRLARKSGEIIDRA